MCGDSSDDTPVINHYLLCKLCHNKGWLTKPFTVIAKRKINKKAKDNHTKPIEVEENIGNHIEPNEEEENKGVENNANDGNDNDNGNDSVHKDDLDSEPDVVESDLVVGSKKRSARSKKTTKSNLSCEADNAFQLMHGPNDFSSLNCNDFNDKLAAADKKAQNRIK